MKKITRNLYRNYFLKAFPDYYAELEKAVGGCKSLLDVGCGKDSPIANFSKKIRSVGVDAFLPAIEESREKGIHDDYCNIDVLDIDKNFRSDSFDCVLASDLIEHLEKDEGDLLIEKMEKLAQKKVIIFTPNGFLPQGELEDNSWQVHKSGWYVDEMRERGYEVIGINGWKPLRAEYAELRFRPKKLWLLISDFTQLFVRNNPEKAFHILCIKKF